MGVSHSLNAEQVDAVIEQVDATADAIQGIEAKCSAAGEYFHKGRQQQETLSKKAEAFSKVVDDFADSLNANTEGVLHTLINILTDFADHVESLEVAIAGLGLKDAPKDMQKDFLVLIVPALVLVVIVAGSNCIFGFMLASDTRMKTLETGELEAGEEKNHFDNLLLFAIFHMLLISLACLYLLGEVLRRVCATKRAPRPGSHTSGGGSFSPNHPPGGEGEADNESMQWTLFGVPGLLNDKKGKPISSLLRTLQMSATSLATKRKADTTLGTTHHRHPQGRSGGNAKVGLVGASIAPFLPTTLGATGPAANDGIRNTAVTNDAGDELLNV
eukprot:NODE_10145_length_1374_cov_1.692061.p1 GENE.NODE_10145_length_1374_cov_1.692061~~NODE_10145_length_1374_cov_1.692061.p1  ORF type:complete len:330 (+),score=43.58 NODE_10145_length_1374_cov_1.692061:244-1233(+)